MDIKAERTPNPAAMKFSVGVPVGGPSTFTDAEGSPTFAADILGIAGVRSVFTTSDFVTVTADPSIDWDSAAGEIIDILASTFG